MSQVFSGDSVNGGSVTLVTSAAAIVVKGNFLNPPFGNAKAVVMGTVMILPGTGTTSVTVNLYRNPSGENLLIGYTQCSNFTPGGSISLTVQGADSIPDGRPVQYALSATQGTATANGTAQISNITTFLISG